MEVTPTCVLFMLLVTYSHATEKFACEGNRVELQCNSGDSLKIMNATYGRLSNDVCPDETLINFKLCQTEDAYAKVKTLCDGKQKCVLNATSSYFGDACSQISKYLNIKYKCQKNAVDLEEPDASEENRGTTTTTTEEPDISIEIETSPPNYKPIPLLNPNYVTTPKPRPVPSRVIPVPGPVKLPMPNQYPLFNRGMNFNFPSPPVLPFPPLIPLMPIPLFG